MSIPGRIYNAATAASARGFAETIERQGFMRVGWLGEESDGGGLLVYDDLRGWCEPFESQTDAYPVLCDHDCQEEERP